MQRLAVNIVPYGYFFYVVGSVPEGHDPRALDEKLIEKYGINVSRRTRSIRNQKGLGNVHYLRFGRFFVLIGTEGPHPFREGESGIKDIRESPIRFAGYSIGYRRSKGGQTWHPSVRIEEEAEYPLLKRKFLELSTKLPAEDLARTFRSLPFEPYAPVRQQLLNLLRLVNGRRKEARLEPLPVTALRLRRRSVRPFGDGPTARGPGGVRGSFR